MVNDPAEYPWSSYHYNALGKDDRLITPHVSYKALGTDNVSRRSNYHALFARLMPDSELDAIRVATNKAWVLGDAMFKTKVEKLMAKQVQPKARSGDRRSELFKKKAISIESDPVGSLTLWFMLINLRIIRLGYKLKKPAYRII